MLPHRPVAPCVPTLPQTTAFPPPSTLRTPQLIFIVWYLSSFSTPPTPAWPAGPAGCRACLRRFLVSKPSCEEAPAAVENWGHAAQEWTDWNRLFWNLQAFADTCWFPSRRVLAFTFTAPLAAVFFCTARMYNFYFPPLVWPSLEWKNWSWFFFSYENILHKNEFSMIRDIKIWH